MIFSYLSSCAMYACILRVLLHVILHVILRVFLGVPAETFVPVLYCYHSMIFNDFDSDFCNFAFDYQSAIMIIIMRYHQQSPSASL